MIKIFFISLINIIFLYAQSYNLRFFELRNDKIDGGYFDIAIQMKSDLSFNLGSSNICFNYDTTALDYNSALSYNEFNQGKYSSTISRNSNIISMNISYDDYQSASFAEQINATWRNLFNVRFIIKDKNKTSGLHFRYNLDYYLHKAVTVVYKVSNSSSFSAELLTNGEVNNLDVPLPVIISNFNVRYTSYDKIEISWIAIEEINIAKYEIEGAFVRSKDDEQNIKYEILGSIAPKSSQIQKKYTFEIANNRNFITLWTRLKIINNDGLIEYSEPLKINGAVPAYFEVFPLYPNPFNPKVNIEFYLPEVSDVEAATYNLFGQILERNIFQSLSTGFHKIEFIGDKYASGIYIFVVTINSRESGRNFKKILKGNLLK